MNEWKIAEVILEACSPIHIGERRMGMVDLTRRWIPGKNFWGVFTSVGAKSVMHEYDPEIYRIVGRFLQEHTIFTPFYVCESQRAVTYIPYMGRNCLEYISYQDGIEPQTIISEYEFDRQYIDSYTSTALDYKTNTAADQMLHELEFIRPRTQFRGYICCNSEITWAHCHELMEAIPDTPVRERTVFESLLEWLPKIGNEGLGGDRTRGFGRVKVIGRPKIETNPEHLFINKEYIHVKDKGFLHRDRSSLQNWSWKWGEIVSATVYSHLNKCSFALIPIGVKGTGTQRGIDLSITKLRDFSGDIEPVLGREWSSEKGAGQMFGTTEFQIVSGSTFFVEQPSKLEVEIGCFGSGTETID